MRSTFWFPLLLPVLVVCGCGRDGSPEANSPPSGKDYRPPSPGVSPSGPESTPEATPDPAPTPSPHMVGLVSLWAANVLDESGAEIRSEHASALFARTGYWWFVPAGTWDSEGVCRVSEPMPDGWSWWDPIDVGPTVRLSGPLLIDLPRSDPRPGIHEKRLEAGTIAHGDYRISWEGGVADEENDIDALPATEIDGLTFPPPMELVNDLDSAVELEPGIELQWTPADSTNRLELVVNVRNDCPTAGSGFRMRCRLVDDGHFVFPEITDRLPPGDAILTIRRETLRTHLLTPSRSILIRGGSSIERHLRNDHGTPCEDFGG